VLAPAAALLDRPANVVLRLLAPSGAADYARRLYALLHELDQSGAARILVVAPPQGEAWDAVHDRLRRAAAAAEALDEGP
jgi:L-threonylcarbamoyladenylate synthase